MNYLESFEFWKTALFFDEETRNEISLLDKENDKKEIEDCFYRDLEFGTGGLRGIMGADINRMNKYTEFFQQLFHPIRRIGVHQSLVQ